MGQNPSPGQENESNHIPDWLRQMEGAEEMPDWLRKLGAASLEGEVTSSLADLAPVLPTEPFVGQQDQGLPSLPEEEEPSAEPEALLTIEPEAQKEMPDWLTEMREATSLGTEEMPVFALEEDERVPEWLAGGDKEEAGETDLAEGPEFEAFAEEGAIPEWLVGIGEEGAEEADLAEVPEFEALAEEGAVPEWLTGIGEEGAEEADLAEVPESEALAEEGAVPEWLAGIGEESVEEADLAEVPEPGAFAEDEDVPDWLKRIGEEVEEEAGFAEVPEPAALDSAEEEGLPDWLIEIDQEALGEEPTAEMPAIPAAEGEHTLEDRERPGWLQDIGEISTAEEAQVQPGATVRPPDVREAPASEEVPPEETIDETGRLPDWLEGLELVETGSPGEETAEREGQVELPDWLQEAGFDREESDAEIIEGILSAETPQTLGSRLAVEAQEEADLSLPLDEIPSWIDELRPKKQVTSQEELPVETSGPLAGLKGLLAPEPLLGIFPRSEYKPAQPIPEAHRAEAKWAEQILSIPMGRPVPTPKAPSKQVLVGWGRWIVYLALLVTVCVAAFLPDNLAALIRPPKMAETRAFYNAVEGLAQGSEVLLVLDYDASLDGELTPQLGAIVRHLLSKNLGIVAVSITPQGVAIVQDMLQENPGFTSGQHYINLGYLPPHPASLQSFVNSPTGATTLFGTGQDPDRTPLGKRVERFDDLDLIVTVSGNQEHIRWWVEQVGSQRQIDIVAGVSASIAPYVQPYYNPNSGQIKGMLVGLAGAADYETQFDPRVSSYYAQQNLVLQGYGQIVLVVILLLSGISLVLGKSS